MFCVFVLLSLPLPRSLTRGHVVSFSDSSHQQQQSGAGIVCACMRVSVCVRAVHSPLRGQGVTMEPRGHSDNPLPPPPLSQPPPSPLLALWSSPGWQPCIRQTHHRLCPPTNTHTHTHTKHSLQQHPPSALWADRYSSSPFIWPELWRSRTSWRKPNTALPLRLAYSACVCKCVCVCVCVCVYACACVCMCVWTDACLYVHVFVNEDVWILEAESKFSCELADAVIYQLDERDKYRFCLFG